MPRCCDLTHIFAAVATLCFQLAMARSALDRLDKIFELPGIDAISPGPVDLARSMGLPATYAAIGAPAPPVRGALDAIEAAAARHDTPVIVIAETPDQVQARWPGATGSSSTSRTSTSSFAPRRRTWATSARS